MIIIIPSALSRIVINTDESVKCLNRLFCVMKLLVSVSVAARYFLSFRIRGQATYSMYIIAHSCSLPNTVTVLVLLDVVARAVAIDTTYPGKTMAPKL